MSSRFRTTGILAAATFVLASCGDDSPADRLNDARESVDGAREAAGALGGMAEAAENMARDAEEGVTVEPVNFRELRELLPGEVAGLPRTEAEGQTTGAMGATISNATGTYQEEPGGGAGYLRTIEVSITDLGAMRGMAMMGLAPWMSMQIDRETDTSYERTTEYDGHPAHEQFSGLGQDREQMEGEIQILVAERFLVGIEGRDVEEERVKAALEEIDLSALADMKDVGVRREP